MNYCIEYIMNIESRSIHEIVKKYFSKNLEKLVYVKARRSSQQLLFAQHKSLWSPITPKKVEPSTSRNHLIAYPVKCNYDGVRR